MRKKNIYTIILAALLAMSFVGCTSQNKAKESNTEAIGADQSNTESKIGSSSNSSKTDKSNTESGDNTSKELPNLTVTFGPKGKGFNLKPYKNTTAAEIIRYVGEADWNLPIYHFDDFENHEVMQYYDIPSRYKITSAPEKVTSEKAGEVYYSSPNRIIIFYQDAKVTGEFTKVGNLESTDGLKEAVENNPVVEGWGNKIISIIPAK